MDTRPLIDLWAVVEERPPLPEHPDAPIAFEVKRGEEAVATLLLTRAEARELGHALLALSADLAGYLPA